MTDGPEDERELDAQRMAAPEVEPDEDEAPEYDDDARDYHECRRYDRWRDDGF